MFLVLFLLYFFQFSVVVALRLISISMWMENHEGTKLSRTNKFIANMHVYTTVFRLCRTRTSRASEIAKSHSQTQTHGHEGEKRATIRFCFISLLLILLLRFVFLLLR